MRYTTARAGPDGAVAEFERIYRCQVAAVTAFFARRTAEPQVVADLTSDTFVAAITSFAGFDPARGSARAWLLGIARHVYAQHCAGYSRHADAVRHLSGHRPLDADETAQLVSRIDAERAGRDLLAAVADLPSAERAAIELVDLAGLTPKEAAKALGVSSGALRIRLFRARTKLRKHPVNEEAKHG